MHRTSIVLALVILAGCTSGPAPVRELGFRERTILTAEEIQNARTPSWTVWELLTQLRPEYLRSRGQSSLRNIGPSTPVVYVNEMRFGEIESLRTMNAEQVLRVQYVNAADATTRFGTDHFGGAIL